MNTLTQYPAEMEYAYTEANGKGYLEEVLLATKEGFKASDFYDCINYRVDLANSIEIDLIEGQINHLTTNKRAVRVEFIFKPLILSRQHSNEKTGGFIVVPYTELFGIAPFAIRYLSVLEVEFAERLVAHLFNLMTNLELLYTDKDLDIKETIKLRIEEYLGKCVDPKPTVGYLDVYTDYKTMAIYKPSKYTAFTIL